MIKIDKYPDFEHKVKCENCGCEYTFDDCDIELEYESFDTPFGEYKIITTNYVNCPICKIRHVIEFKGVDNENQ